MEGLNLEKVQAELANIVQLVTNDVKQKFRELNQGPAILDSLRAFAAAVDWSVSLRSAQEQAAMRADAQAARELQPAADASQPACPAPSTAARRPPPAARRRHPTPLPPACTQERWIIALLASHVVLLVTVLALRRNQAVQALVFFFISERLPPCLCL